MDFHTTEPQGANPFASTVMDPRDLHRRVEDVMARAERRRAKIPQPGSYWEEPGHHGLGKREVSLRKPRSVPMPRAIRTQVRKALRLPPLPKRSALGGGTTALIAAGVIGTGLLAGYLVWRSRQRRANGGAQVGDMSGLELLGCEP